MSQQTAAMTYLKDYLPPSFEVNKIFLTFEIFSDKTHVRNEMSLNCLKEGERLILDGEELELCSIMLDGRVLSETEYSQTESQLEIKVPFKQAEIVIETVIYPHNNKALSGLYQSDGLFCTQCEAEGFRRMTYYLDRPDVLSIYTTKVIAEKRTNPVLLSNGNLIEQGELENGRHFATWHDPFKKPSYLFALVAGDLAVVEDTFTTKSGRLVDLKMYVEHGNEQKCQHAINSLQASMKWDEERYGREYDLDIYMIVAVSTFNMGAMENKGLNIFNDKYVLARPELATDHDYAGIEGVIAHEYFHNWTGNRITCRDWFQLSLKEGLTVFRDQCFSQDMNSKTVCRIQDVDILRTHQFPEDSGPTAHAVYPDAYLEINNFYTSTIYNKGAEVIRMQHTLLGEEGFRKGTDHYFECFDGQAVTIDDFVGSMEAANQVDLRQFRRWYKQAGTPVVSVDESFVDGTLSLKFTQHCAKTPGQEKKEPFHIPIRYALFTPDGEELIQESSIIELKEESETIEIKALSVKPRVSLLRDFSAPIILQRHLPLEYLIDLASFEQDGFAKSEAVKQIAKSQILALEENPEHEVPKAVLELYQHLLEESHQDNALKALLLKTPSFEYLVSGQKNLEVDAILSAIDAWESQIDKLLESLFIQWYGILESESSAEISGEQAGLRALKNQCLYYLTRSDKGLMLARKQQGIAKTMTDELAAFKLLCERDNEFFQEARDAFYQKWQDESLVLDKWFSVLAASDHENILADIDALSQHEKFNKDNPNKVRALIGAFVKLNLKHFHKSDGSGYRFLGKWVKDIDPQNPQLASWLVQELTLWQRYEPKRQALMKKELESLKALPGLSKDVFEKVSKALL